jgi:DNA (cytosine-5)-methyltransferase 1
VGFEVVGVDIKPQRNYPLPFILAYALPLDPKFIALFDAVHASPPCQAYSDLAKRNGNADEWPRLIEPIRDGSTLAILGSSASSRESEDKYVTGA